jgi:hypothetical protein
MYHAPPVSHLVAEYTGIVSMNIRKHLAYCHYFTVLARAGYPYSGYTPEPSKRGKD